MLVANIFILFHITFVLYVCYLGGGGGGSVASIYMQVITFVAFQFNMTLKQHTKKKFGIDKNKFIVLVGDQKSFLFFNK